MGQWKKKLSILIMGCIFIVGSAIAQTTASSMLQNLLSRYTTYEANFTQTTYDNKNKKIQESNGKVYLKRPGKFRWQTEKPNQQIIIANNNTLWIYDVLLQQVTRKSLAKGEGVNPAVLLTGDLSELLAKYKVEQIPSRGRVVTFKLNAKSPKSSFKSIEMQFEKGRLTAMLVRNDLGQTNLFRFSKIKLDKTLSPQLFNFKVPPGAEVTEQ